MAFKLGMMVDLCMAYMLTLMLMTLNLMQGDSGLTEENIQRWIFSTLTTKQAISIKLAATVLATISSIFIFSLKLSVAFVLTDGHTSISSKTSVYMQSHGQCLLSECAFGVETDGKDINFTIALSPGPSKPWVKRIIWLRVFPLGITLIEIVLLTNDKAIWVVLSE